MRLVLLPGLDGTGRLFQPLLAQLPPTLEPLVVPYSNLAGTYAEILPAVIRELPAELPFILLAESFSGPLAIQAAAARPPGLKAIVLSSSFSRSPLRGGRVLRFLVRPQALHVLPRNVILRALLGRHAKDSIAADVSGAISSLPASTIALRLREVLGVDVSPELKAIDVPVLYLKARNDALVSPASAEHVRRCAPETKIVTIAGPHLLLQTAPRDAASAIASFTVSLPRTDSGQ